MKQTRPPGRAALARGTFCSRAGGAPQPVAAHACAACGRPRGAAWRARTCGREGGHGARHATRDRAKRARREPAAAGRGAAVTGAARPPTAARARRRQRTECLQTFRILMHSISQLGGGTNPAPCPCSCSCPIPFPCAMLCCRCLPTSRCACSPGVGSWQRRRSPPRFQAASAPPLCPAGRADAPRWPRRRRVLLALAPWAAHPVMGPCRRRWRAPGPPFDPTGLTDTPRAAAFVLPTQVGLAV
jgi:hypothetical protein